MLSTDTGPQPNRNASLSQKKQAYHCLTHELCRRKLKDSRVCGHRSEKQCAVTAGIQILLKPEVLAMLSQDVLAKSAASLMPVL